MKRIRWIVSHLEEILLTLLLIYISGCMMLQIFMRHVMQSSLSWSEESIRFAFVWLVFLGFGLAVKEDRHISITFLKSHLGPKAQIAITVFANVVFFIYAVAMMVFGSQVVRSFIQSGQTSAALGIPRYFMFLAAPIGFALVIIRLVQVTWKLLKHGPKEEGIES